MTTGNNNEFWGQGQHHGQQPGYDQGFHQQPGSFQNHDQGQSAANPDDGGMLAGNPYQQQQSPYGPQPSGAQQGFGNQSYGQQPYGQAYGLAPNNEPPHNSNATAWIILGIVIVAILATGAAIFFVLGGDDDRTAGSDISGAPSDTVDNRSGQGTDSPDQNPTTVDSNPTMDPADSSPGPDGKPSRADVRVGLELILQAEFENQGLEMADIEAAGVSMDEYYNCVIDSIYDAARPQTLETIVAGDPDAWIFGSDYTLLTESSDSCIDSQL